MNTETQDRAAELAGNWKKGSYLTWWDKPPDADNWLLYNYRNRDSGILDQSNAATIEKMFGRFVKAGVNVKLCRFGHWLCGWTDALAVRVYDNRNKITNAFKLFVDVLDDLEHDPVLDYDDYADREYQATTANIAEAAWLHCEVELSDDTVGLVYDWLDSHYRDAVENMDGSGGYPTEKEITTALTARGIAVKSLKEA